MNSLRDSKGTASVGGVPPAWAAANRCLGIMCANGGVAEEGRDVKRERLKSSSP